MEGMLGYILRRLLWAPLILLAVSFILFIITRFGPGDPYTVMAGQLRDPEAIARVRAEKGLDKPFLVQYGIYLKNVLRGDLGESVSIYRGVKVWDIIWPRIMVSAQMGVVALVIAFALGIPVGIYAALRQGTWVDPFSISTFLLFQSIPVLVAVPFLLLVFALKLDWLPAGGWGGPTVEIAGHSVAVGILSRHIVIPALALSLPSVAGIARLTRATTLAVLGEDYVRAARAKGLSEFTVVSRHVARNALLPLVTVIGLSLVALVEGAFFTETILGIPGVGRLAFQSVTSRDYDIILALALIVATVFVLANILIDIAYTFIDPRIRYERREAT